MDNLDSFQRVERAALGDGTLRPLYDSYCFSRIPATVRRLLGLAPVAAGAPLALADAPLPDAALPRPGAVYDVVILVLLDAFGWRFFERFRKERAFAPLGGIAERGVVSKITAQFPSTTSAHVTTVYSGLTPAASGIYEWHQLLPSIDDMITPLTFSFSRDRAPQTLLAAGVRAADFLPPPHAIEALVGAGVETVLWNDRGFFESPYNIHMRGGAEGRGFRTYRHGLDDLRAWALAGGAPRFAYFYVPDFDGTCHTHGPGAGRTAACAREFFDALEERLLEPLRGKLPRALILFTADHGQIEVKPSRAIYVDRDLPEVLPLLARNARGQILAPAGSRRDFFLHAAPGAAAALADRLAARLEGRAEVRVVADLIAAGFFGPGAPSPAFLERVGDVVVLPRRDESVFWFGAAGRHHERFLGHHGGLSRAEMESVLVAMEV